MTFRVLLAALRPIASSRRHLASPRRMAAATGDFEAWARGTFFFLVALGLLTSCTGDESTPPPTDPQARSPAGVVPPPPPP
ncbi:MAG: hypothetical protein AB1486_29090, partial [Planctomycetota bacterium]